MIAKPQPLSTRGQDRRPTNGLLRRARGAQWLEAKLNDVSSDPVRFRRLQIILGVVALAWVGCVGTLMLRPTSAPETVAAVPPLASLPPLVSAAPPLEPPGAHQPDHRASRNAERSRGLDDTERAARDRLDEFSCQTY